MTACGMRLHIPPSEFPIYEQKTEKTFICMQIFSKVFVHLVQYFSMHPNIEKQKNMFLINLFNML